MSKILKCDAPGCEETVPSHEDRAETWWVAEGRWGPATLALKNKTWVGEVHGCTIDHLAEALATDIRSTP